MPSENSMGIYVLSDKTFYYLEAGPNYIGNSVDRVRKALIHRGLIQGLLDSPNKLQYEIISYKDAQRKDMNMKPIYISKHLENIMTAQQKPTTTGGFK